MGWIWLRLELPRTFSSSGKWVYLLCQLRPNCFTEIPGLYTRGLRALSIVSVNIWVNVLLIFLFVPWLLQSFSFSLALSVVWGSFCSEFSFFDDYFAFLLKFPEASSTQSSGKRVLKTSGWENVIVVAITLNSYSSADHLAVSLWDLPTHIGKYVHGYLRDLGTKCICSHSRRFSSLPPLLSPQMEHLS